MSLRGKTIIIGSIVIIGLMAFLWVLSQTVLLDKFADLEERRTTTNVERVVSALSEKVAFLDGFTNDWAAWDDTYAFVEDANEGYIEVNLVDETFVNSDLNVMLFINATGQVVFSKAFDLENEREMPLPQGLQEHLTTDDILVHHRDVDSIVKGLILLPEGPMLVASRPILTSDNEGPVRGTLIMGRYLDSAEVEQLAEITHLSLAMHKFDDLQLPADFQTARSFLVKGMPTFVHVLDSDIIAGYTQINDIYGKPCVMLRLDMPREIYLSAKAAINYFIFSILAVCLMFSILNLWLLEKFVISRLIRLQSSVVNIGTSSDLSARVSVTGNDELSKLANAVNVMLTGLEQGNIALLESEVRYRTILEDMEEGYYEVDLAGNITFVNGSICRILGYGSEEVIGTNYRSYVGEEKPIQIYKDVNSVYRTGKTAKWFSWEFLTKSGEARFIEASVAQRFNAQGEVIGFRGIFNDVTERKAIERQVLMTSKLASIGELASGVAHELNNPLTGVMGYAQLLVDNKDLPLEVKSDLNKVYQESQRAAKIVQNLLSFARRRKPEKGYFDVNELIQKTLELRSYELKISNIKVWFNLASELPEIKADYYQIQQVILNIVINAEQALIETGRQGKITVTTSTVENSIRISIADSGPGIPKENINRIFDPFFTTKEVGKGTGLGLSVCHGIVTAHGGNIYAESEDGKGAEFIIDLPIAVAEEPDIRDRIVRKEDNRQYRRKANENILIIDDESGVRDVLARVFSETGYQTDSASDAKSALTKLNKNGYDMFIIDLKLPRVSGMRLYEIMKQKYPSSAEKVMFITGDAITQSTQDFLNSAGRPYLTKPFNPKVAVELVEEMLRGKATAKAA
jgi:PAS domain S-box-containing protein